MKRKEITRQTCALESAAKVSGRQPHLLLWSPYFNVCTPQVFAFSDFFFQIFVILCCRFLDFSLCIQFMCTVSILTWFSVTRIFIISFSVLSHKCSNLSAMPST